MIKIKRFSKILNTSGNVSFKRGRNYDMDMNRLGRGNVQRELGNFRDLHKELRELNRSISRGEDLKDD